MKATESKCCVCGKQGVDFLLVISPDMPACPCCRECFHKEKIITHMIKLKERQIASRMFLNLPKIDVENETMRGFLTKLKKHM